MKPCEPPQHSWHFVAPRDGERTYCNCGDTIARFVHDGDRWRIELVEPSKGELFSGSGDMGRGDELHLSMSTEFLRQRLDTRVTTNPPTS
jgi:hypothetical protein